MPIEQKLERCAPGDPRRCQANGMQSQCPYLAEEGSTYCVRHANNTEMQAANIEEQRNYNLGKWRARVNELADNTKAKSIREEVGIMRLLIENVLVRCKDEHELFLQTGRLSDLLMKAEKLISSCHRLETANGQLLDRTVALSWASAMVGIIADEIKDPIAIDRISEKMMLAFTTVMDPQNGTSVVNTHESKALTRAEQTQLDELFEVDGEV